MENKKTEQLIEELAELEHQQWWKWSYELAGKEELSLDRIERWRKMWCQYSELPEEIKDFDRVWARKVLAKLKIMEVKQEAMQSEARHSSQA